ncbi:hypothetical protein niasHS_012116 [Heterodera schachtii]|uniref:Uncharacterized protein n=1 Tax=Heterodera schachtii TaxID=97005 RepID=A0ABD2ID89_HETSC
MDRMLGSGREVYDKQSTPTQYEQRPTSVKLAMYIEGIGSFRTHTMDFQLDVYLQQFWRDPRLAHNESSRILIRDKSILERIWHPDVYFANARIAQFHEVTQPNFLLWIEPDGSILYDTRVSMIVICAMNLKNFPLDSQWCHLRILSYAYDINHLLIEWVDNAPITKNMNITMSDMDIVKLVPGTCDGNYSTGIWSCVTAEFFVSRELTHHILQTYVPTTLIVVISWFSFWLDVEAVPARVSLAITTLLTLSTQANSVKNSLPEVSYMKSLDLFLAVSVLFVFGVLIEFTIVNYTQRNAKYCLDGSISKECNEEEDDRLTTMAAAGLLMDEKGGGKEFAIWKWLRKTMEGKWKRTKEQKEKHKMAIREDKTQQNHCKNSGSKSKRHLRRGKASPSDLEGGKRTKDERRAKNICALQSQHQLRHLPRSEANGGGKEAAEVPIIVYEESDNEAEQHTHHQQQQQQKTVGQPPRTAVDRREAARIACWASPELSCEGLSLKVRETQPRGTTEAGEAPPEVCASVQTDCCSSPTSSTLSSSAVLLVPDCPVPSLPLGPALCDGTAPPALPSLFAPSQKPFLRRASALASLLDPINIGSGEKTEEQPKQRTEKDNLGREKGTTRRQQPMMSSQAKWRHAVRKLQMNKREAGRIQAKKIDAWSRWAFPLSYLSFHGAYWYYYLRVAA